MKDLRNVTHILLAEDIDMGGVIVKQALPTQRVQQWDPFLLLHHGIFETRDDMEARHQGIGPHPHRGFSPVTFVISGEVHHRDSRGHDQIASAGEVQWMHAGAGIIHSERPSKDLVENGGHQEIIQLWINSPAASKMKPPHYQYRSQEDIPSIEGDSGKLLTRVVAGRYAGKGSTIETESDLLILWSESKANGRERFTIPRGYNLMIYFISGSCTISGHGKVEPQDLVLFDHQGDEVEIVFEADAKFILFAGRPIEEEVTQYGPFVMNNQTQIMEAMRDYQMGKMGILIEE